MDINSYGLSYKNICLLTLNVSISMKTSQIDFSIQRHYVGALFIKRFMALLLKLHQRIIITRKTY